MRRRALIAHLLCVLGLAFLFPSVASAQQQVNQVWPEVDTYANVTPRLRFLFVVRENINGDNGDTQNELAASVDYAMKPLLRRRLRELDPDQNKLLVFRAGYWNYTTITGKSANENRLVLEPTSRFPLFANIMLEDRNRADLRWISGQQFSWRYRNRLSLIRSFTIHHYDLTPYVRAEMFYDSRYSKINRMAYFAGCRFPLTKRTEFEPYFRYQLDTSHPRFVETKITGIILSLFF